jgi:tyrosine-protein kinase Etk/Wzc
MQKKLMAKLRNGKIDSHVLANSVPDDAAVESLRGLRNALHFATQKSSNNIIVIAGPTKGIGKSFVALNLATLLALTGKRVALIDTDVFGGNLYKLMHLASSPGITDYVLEAVAPGGILQPTGITGLSLISQGTRRPNSSELLLNEAFPKLLKFLTGRYDHIIIDTPGNLDTATAGIVAQFAGCTLLVLKAGANSFEQVEESHRRLIHAGANVRGVVFNEIY